MGHSFRHVLVTLDEDNQPSQWRCIYCPDVKNSVHDIGEHLKCHEEEFGLRGDKIQLVVNVSRWCVEGEWVGVRSTSLEYGCPRPTSSASPTSEDGCHDDESLESNFQNSLDDPESRPKTRRRRATQLVPTSTKIKGHQTRHNDQPSEEPKRTRSNDKTCGRNDETSAVDQQKSVGPPSGDKPVKRRGRGRPKSKVVPSKAQPKDRSDRGVVKSTDADFCKVSDTDNEGAATKTTVISSTKKEASTKTPKEFACSQCGWSSGRHFNYHRHMLKSCSVGRRPFTCTYCNKEIDVAHSKSNYGLQFRKCQGCGSNFYQLSEYAEHVRIGCNTRAPGKLLCLVCRKTFKWFSHLQSHIAETHCKSEESQEAGIDAMMGRVDEESKSKSQYLCGVCDWSSSVHYNYHRHYFTHSNDQPFQCNYCSKQIDPVKFHLNKKRRIKSGKVKSVTSTVQKTECGVDIVCEHCGFTTRRRDVFTKHQVSHVPEQEREVHRCQLCAYETFYVSSLRTHMAAKHGKKDRLLLTTDMVLCCELCGSYTDDSREAIIAHKQETCPYRDKDITQLKRLEEFSGNKQTPGADQHQKSLEEHQISPLQIKITNPMQPGRTKKYVTDDAKKKVFVCDYCDFVCVRRWNMVRHKQCQHKKSAIDCHLCGYSTKYIPWLCTHYRKIHFLDPPAAVISLVEQRKANKRSKFVDREKPKRFIAKKREMCHLCGKHVIAGSIKKHLTVTHGDRNQRKCYRCNWEGCQYSTSLYTYLTRHTKRVHMAGNRQIKKTTHACETCAFKTSTRRGLLEHRKTAHAPSEASPVRDEVKVLNIWPIGPTPPDLIHHLTAFSQVPMQPNMPTTADYANFLAPSKTIDSATSPQQGSASGNQTTTAAEVGNLPSLVDVAAEHRITLAEQPSLQKGESLDFHKQF